MFLLDYHKFLVDYKFSLSTKQYNPNKKRKNILYNLTFFFLNNVSFSLIQNKTVQDSITNTRDHLPTMHQHQKKARTFGRVSPLTLYMNKGKAELQKRKQN